MFNIFKKTFLPLENYPENWAISEEKNKGLIIRLNTGLKAAIGHSSYPIKVGIAVPIRPGTDIVSFKNKIEDQIADIWEKDKKGTIVAIITGMNAPLFIEILSYSAKDTDFSSLHNMLKSLFPAEDIQMYAEQDPKWEAYQTLIS